MNPRLAAYRALMDLGSRHTDEVVDDYLTRIRLSDPDRRFFSRLVIGVTENRIYLDYVIDSFSKVRVAEEVRVLLRLGLYQLKFSDVPAYAAVSETLSVAEEVGERKAKGFINAVLRSYIRNNCSVRMPREKDEWMSVRYSYPLWLVRYWIGLLGPERTEKLLAAGNEKPPLTLRVNTSLIERERFLSRLREAKIEAEETKESAVGIVVRNAAGKKITQFPGYDDGHFIVQDESSQLAVLAGGVREGDVCVDVCCSPGGKTTHLAERADMVHAFDISKSRLGITMRNVVRMKAQKKVKLGLVDATKGVKELNDSADFVLVDAPCSALGTIRRNPDIKYNRIGTDIGKNAKMQRIVLKRAAQYVKCGGRLLYSTCTITREENEDQVRRFLEKHPDFVLLEERLLLPSEGGTDGFYFAVMERK